MKLWRMVGVHGSGNPINLVPKLSNIIQDEWQWQLRVIFNMNKKSGSFGPISFVDLQDYIKNESQPIADYFYANDEYVTTYPTTYRKTDELYGKIIGGNLYTHLGKGRKFGLKIDIPLKTNLGPGEKPEAYRHLEGQRSYVKAAFIRAWPHILDKIMEQIVKI